MPKDRGRYFSTYTTMVDSPEWDRLSLHASASWWALKHSPENTIAGVFPIFREQVSARSKVPLERVQDALRELESERWILMEGRWVWLRNHLRYEPTFNPVNPNHAKWLIDCVKGLPRIRLSVKFVAYYKALNYLPQEFNFEMPPPVDAIPMVSPMASEAMTLPDLTLPDHTSPDETKPPLEVIGDSDSPPANGALSASDSDSERREYVAAVWEAFRVAARQDRLTPTSTELVLIQRWRDGGIPLRVVLRAIQDTALKGAARRLLYFGPSVEEAAERWAKATG